MKSLQVGWIFAISMPATSGFLNNLFQTSEMRPDLLQVTEQQEETKLKIQLHVGNVDEGRLAVSDMVVELHHDLAQYEHVGLPGAEGKHKHLSCGPRRLEILSRGRYIDLSGTQYVATEKGCWEMCWRKERPAGTLVCGFELPKDYNRNAARLPKGVIYLSFPVWTKEGLKQGQEEKLKVQEQCMQCLYERDEALYHAEHASNPIMKAYHRQQAEAAAEKYNALPHSTIGSIPTSEEVVNLQDDLLLTKKGLVFAKTETEEGNTGHLLLGMTTVTLDPNYKRLMP